MGEGEASCPTRRFDAGGILCVFQGKATKYGGKRLAQAALIACEYRFLYRKAARKAAKTPFPPSTKKAFYGKMTGRRSFYFYFKPLHSMV